MKSLHRLPLLVGTVAVLAPPPAVADIEHVCTLGATLRRIEVNFADGSRAGPCEVVYVKETERAGRRSVLWTADRDGGFCIGKAQDLASRLTQHGWTCGAEGGDEQARVAPEPPPLAPVPPPERPERVAGAGAAAEPMPDPARDASPERAPEEERDATTAALAAGSETAPETGPVMAAITEGDAAADPAPGAPATIDDQASGALEQAVARDLARLKTSAEDSVEASIAGFGDLNGDDRPDAAVLITFDADGSDHAQYLVAYVAEQDTFRPAASRFIGGRYRKVFGADVEAIEDGQIQLQLQVLQADDPYCCPSGTEAALFALQNGELVDLN